LAELAGWRGFALSGAETPGFWGVPQKPGVSAPLTRREEEPAVFAERRKAVFNEDV